MIFMSIRVFINLFHKEKLTMILINNIQIMLAKKELRDAKRYKQLDIARESGISQSVLSRIMSKEDIGGFTLETAHLLAAWLGCSIEDLYKKPEQNK
jgi:transcriptional regulator with XRE-family HTH domain